MEKSVSFFVRSLFIFCVFLTSMFNTCFGAENVLSSVELSQKDEGYELKLKTDGPISFKKKIESKDSVYFDLKNMAADEKIDTIYNDVSDIDGVVIQQIDKSSLRIYVNGLNAANTTMVSEAPALLKNEAKEVVINRPIREYAPIIGEEKYEEKIDWENNGFNVQHLISSVIKKIKSSDVDWALLLSIMVVIASIIGLKKAFTKSTAEQEPLIGISQNKKVFEELANETAEIENQDLQQELIEKLNEHNGRNIVRPAAYNEEVTAPRRAVNGAMESYALNSYQKMQNNNPYGQNTISRNAPNNNFMSGSTIAQPKRRHLPVNEPVTRAESTSYKGPVNPQPAPQRKAFTTNVNRNAGAQTPQSQLKNEPIGTSGRNIENIKFLESVTKIYEQSGRKDLANGLKANLAKNRMVV